MVERELDLMYRQLVRAWRKMTDELAEALQECWLDVSNGTDDSAHRVDATLARYNTLNDGEVRDIEQRKAK